LARRSFADQYSPQMLEPYEQLSRDKKVLIVDDWHKTKLNQEGQTQAIKHLQGLFGQIVMFVDDIYPIEVFTGKDDPFLDFGNYEIREFGHVLRGELIERWHSLGREHTLQPAELAHEVSQAEKIVQTLLGKNLLPSYPVIVLTILQACEAARNATLPSGSYGYLYEVLITSALDKVSKNFADVDASITFISRLAFICFKESSK